MTIKAGKTEGGAALLSGTANNPNQGSRPIGWNLLEPHNLPALVNEAGQLITPSGDVVGGGTDGVGGVNASMRLPPDFDARVKRNVSAFRAGRSQFQALQAAIDAAQPGECVVLDTSEAAVLGGDGVWQLTGRPGVLVVAPYGTEIIRATTNPDPYANFYINHADMQLWGLRLDGVCTLLDAGAARTVIKGCVVENVDHSTSSNSDVRFNGAHGIRISGASGVLLEGNLFQKINDNAVIAYTCDRLTVQGNSTDDTARLLHIPGGTNANNVTVIGNSMCRVKRIGLELQHTGSNTLVARNIFWGYKTGEAPVAWGAFSLAINGSDLIVEDNILFAWQNGALLSAVARGMEFSGTRSIARRNVFFGFVNGLWMTGDVDSQVEENVFYGASGAAISSAAPDQTNGIRRTLSIRNNKAINCGGPTVDVQFPNVYTSLEQVDNVTYKSVAGLASDSYQAHKIGPVARETGVDGSGNTTYVLDGQGVTFRGNKLILSGTRDTGSTATFALVRNEGSSGSLAGAIVEGNAIRFRGREPDGGGGFLSYATYARLVEHTAASYGSRWVWYRNNEIDGCVDYVPSNGNSGDYIATGNIAKNIPEANLFNIGGSWGTQPVFSNNAVFRAPNGWSFDQPVGYMGSTVIMTPTGSNATMILRSDIPARFNGFEQRVAFEQSSATSASVRVVISSDGTDNSASRVDEFQLMESGTVALFRASPQRSDKWLMAEYSKLPAKARKTGVTTSVPASGTSTVTVGAGDGLYMAANGARAAVSVMGISVPAGITVSAATTAANTVTVTYTNSTGAVVNIPSHTLVVNVLR